MDLLKTGAPLKDKEIQLANGRKFKATLQVNVEQRGIEFVPGGRSVRQSAILADNDLHLAKCLLSIDKNLADKKRPLADNDFLTTFI